MGLCYDECFTVCEAICGKSYLTLVFSLRLLSAKSFNVCRITCTELFLFIPVFFYLDLMSRSPGCLKGETASFNFIKAFYPNMFKLSMVITINFIHIMIVYHAQDAFLDLGQG